MHDPMTVAWEIKRPWPVKSTNNFKYYPSMVTIWHVDPERDGSDDSCGWFSPKLTKEEIEKAKKIAQFEHKYLFNQIDENRYQSKVDSLTGVFTILQQVAWQIFKKPLKDKHMKHVISLSSNYHDSFRDSFLNPVTMHDIERLWILLTRNFKKIERPWYQHPRYHFWHFKIQIPFIQNLKRFLWGKCSECRKGLGWNKSVVSHQWESEGPKWFRSEKSVSCYRCSGPSQCGSGG